MKITATLTVGMPGIILFVLTGDFVFALMPALGAVLDMLTGGGR